MSEYRYGFRQSPSPGQFKAASDDCERLRQALTEIRIAGWDNHGGPVFNEQTVCFNGKGNEGCETFLLHAKKSIDTIKTMNRPYDFLVRCCLIVFSHHCRHFEVADSAGFNGTRWSQARTFCEEILGYGSGFEIQGS